MKYIAVLGFQLLEDASPDPILKDRIAEALRLYREETAKGSAVKFIFCGGGAKTDTTGKVWTEAKRMKDMVRNPEGYFGSGRSAVLSEHILKEKESADTNQNIFNLMQQNVLGDDDEIIILTSTFHVVRNEALYELMRQEFNACINGKQFPTINVVGDNRFYATEGEIAARERNEKVLVARFREEDAALNRFRFRKLFGELFAEHRAPLMQEVEFDNFVVGNKLDLSCLYVHKDGVFNDDFFSALASYIKDNDIRELNIAGNELGDDLVTTLMDKLSDAQVYLSVLSLDSNNISDQGFAKIVSSDFCPSELNMGHNNFGKDTSGLVSISDNLQKLFLHQTGSPSVISGAWLQKFLELPSKISELDLRGRNVAFDDMNTVKSLVAFIEKSPRLNLLNVSDCGFDDAKLNEMAGVLSKLRHFIVYGNGFTADSAELLLAAAQQPESVLRQVPIFGHPISPEDTERQRFDTIEQAQLPEQLRANIEQSYSGSRVFQLQSPDGADPSELQQGVQAAGFTQ